MINDNAHPHATHIVNDYYDEIQIEKLDWTTYNSDLNPMEHL